MTDRSQPAACHRLREALEAYVDGELEVAVGERLERHLEGCPGCREELALALEVRDGLRGLPTLEAPRATVAAVLEIARAEATPRRPARGWRWWSGLDLRPALAAAAVA